MADLIITERSNIVAIADAVRSNTGETKEITLSEIVDGINYLGSNVSLDTSDATATSSDILSGKTAYVDGEKVTGTIQSVEAKTVTPATYNKTAVAKGVYTAGSITVAGDSNLKAENIAEGVTIFGVTGSHTGGVDTSDATATAEDILSGETAYVDGEKVTGTIETKTPSDLTADGATVTVPSGYYADNATKSVSTATQATPSISVNASGLITATATQTAGYVAAGSKSGTKQLTTQAAKTVTPSTSSQTVVASGVYTTGAVTVAAIPSTYVKPTTTKTATTYTPTTSNQTIAAGTYCSGDQTIKGDANLKAENIAEGISIFGVSGTHSGGGITPSGTLTVVENGTYDVTNYASAEVIVGSSANICYIGAVEPSESYGIDGDIYIVQNE